MVSPPSKLKMFTGNVCVLLASVSLKLMKIKIKLIYATTSSREKKQNGGWNLSDTDWFYFSFYNPSCLFLWSELIRVQFFFFIRSELVRVDPSWSDPDWRSELIRSSLRSWRYCVGARLKFWRLYYNVSAAKSHSTTTQYRMLRRLIRSDFCTCLMQGWICLKCPHTSHVEGDQFLNSQHAWGCWEIVAGGIVFEIPRLTVKCTLSLTKWINNLSRYYWIQIPAKTSCTQDTDDVKQKASLFSVQEKSAWYCLMVVVLLFFVICVRYTK